MSVCEETDEQSACLANVLAFERQGECFRAYDLAVQGVDRWPHCLRLKHRAVLALCNAGAYALARKRFEAYGLGDSGDLDCLALDGRLYKAAAFASRGEARLPSLRSAAEAYARAYALACREAPERAHYPGINLATTMFLADPRDPRVAEIATTIAKSLVPRLQDGKDANDYWLWATAIEAALLLDDQSRLQALLPGAIAAGRDNAVARASSVRQLREILAVQGRSTDLIAALIPAPIWHFTGQLPAGPGRSRGLRTADEARVVEAIVARMRATTVGGVYGALAAGADIVFAETALQHDVPLHVVLPFAVDDFVATSVAPFGPEWVSRFESCLSRAASVRLATDDAYLGDDALFAHASQMAMGLAVLAATHLSTQALQIAIWDGTDSGAEAGTAADVRCWRALGREQQVIPIDPSDAADLVSVGSYANPTASRRSTRAMLFGDLKDFSRLSDRQVLSFGTVVLPVLGAVIDRLRERTALVNTWGDGLFLVFNDAGDAAETALALQQAMAGIDLAAAGLPLSLGLRIGIHLGPAFCLDDPIQHRPNFFGAQVSRAARVEPVTPEGCVYVTEPVAAALALAHAGEFACDYVGMTEAAKSFGPMRMFLLRVLPGAR